MASKRSNTRSSGNPNQKLPLNKTIPLGIQHVLAMFAGKYYCTHYCSWSFWANT